MLFYKVHFDGTEQEIRTMILKMSEYDEYFPKEEIGNDFDFMDEENHEFSNVEEIEKIAKSLVSVASNAKFSIVGTVENHGYYMDFEIEYDSNELISRSSDWYTSYYICEFNYKDYKDFCDKTGLETRVSKEQFEEWLNEECEIAVLDSKEGTVCKKPPLSERCTNDEEDIEFGCCPICGEMCDDITPPIIGEDGKMYHYWCAEDAKISGKVWGSSLLLVNGETVYPDEE